MAELEDFFEERILKQRRTKARERAEEKTVKEEERPTEEEERPNERRDTSRPYFEGAEVCIMIFQ